jgi:hypothetical protein
LALFPLRLTGCEVATIGSGRMSLKTSAVVGHRVVTA